MLLVWFFVLFLKKIFHRTGFRRLLTLPTKQKASSRARRRVLLCYIFMQAKEKRGLHKYSRDTPPPAWYSKRFVDKVNKRL